MILWCDFCFVKPHKTSASGDNIRVECPVTAWEPLVALTALSTLLSAQAGRGHFLQECDWWRLFYQVCYSADILISEALRVFLNRQ